MIPTATAIDAKKGNKRLAPWCVLFNHVKDLPPCRLTWGDVGALYGCDARSAQDTRRGAVNRAREELAKYGRKVTVDKYGLVLE